MPAPTTQHRLTQSPRHGQQQRTIPLFRIGNEYVDLSRECQNPRLHAEDAAKPQHTIRNILHLTKLHSRCVYEVHDASPFGALHALQPSSRKLRIMRESQPDLDIFWIERVRCVLNVHLTVHPFTCRRGPHSLAQASKCVPPLRFSRGCGTHPDPEGSR